MQPKPKNVKAMNRRNFVTGGAAIAGIASAGCLIETGGASGTQASTGSSAPLLIASDRNAVVETTAGKVRGFTRNGIHTFKGVPYGATTEASGRFAAPSKRKPWAGIRSSMYYGPTCPQAARTGWLNDENAFLFQWDDGQPGEDCLRVNLWTPGLNDGKKRPVMVWLHGGGWAAGSGQEQPAYNGENLSRRGDVVGVGLNHRLNTLGYLNLAAYGEKYSASANAGVLDLVSALVKHFCCAQR